MKSAAYTVAIAVLAAFFLGAGNEVRVRPPVAAGIYYPAEPAQLRAAVEQYLSGVDPLPLPAPVIGCVVPHSPYKSSGSVMAGAFKYLKPGQYQRVIVLAPALRADFRGCSVPSLQYYRTPLGDVEIDAPAIRRICVNSLIEIRGLVYREDAYSNPQIARVAMHEKETAVEVILPFLQVQLGSFKLVPILCGTLEKVNGGLDERSLATIVNTLHAIVDQQTLVVVCSEFTRYGAIHNYTPFTRDIIDNITTLDMEAFQLIENRRIRGFRAYLDETKNTISAPLALSIFMGVLPDTSRGVLAGYDLSGRMTGNPRTSVSFGALVFLNGMREPSRSRAAIRISESPAAIEPPAAAEPPIEVKPPADAETANDAIGKPVSPQVPPEEGSQAHVEQSENE